jgi:hypothetical protein
MRAGWCTRSAFATKQTAQAKINRTMWKRRNGKSGYTKSTKLYTVYQCDICLLWHVKEVSKAGPMPLSRALDAPRKRFVGLDGRW